MNALKGDKLRTILGNMRVFQFSTDNSFNFCRTEKFTDRNIDIDVICVSDAFSVVEKLNCLS